MEKQGAGKSPSNVRSVVIWKFRRIGELEILRVLTNLKGMVC